MDYKKMKIEDIIAWCVANKETEWLKKTAAITYPTKDGKQRKISFIEIKLLFCQKFMADIMPKAKEKKPTIYEMIEAL